MEFKIGDKVVCNDRQSDWYRIKGIVSKTEDDKVYCDTWCDTNEDGYLFKDQLERVEHNTFIN